MSSAKHQLTPEQATFTDDYGFGGAMTAPVETQLADIAADPDPEWRVTPQWLAARAVIQDYRSQAHGRHTKVWLSYGTSTGELTVAEAREALKVMRDFLPQLEAVIEIAEESASKDFEGDPEIARLDDEYEDRKVKEAA
ncbi:hypothetical protein ACFZDK_24835 [Streptomyces sp. NPDC007901]|uniref:hypothetical protein n=1 Tax=Streptomyces sp. NPDC007901 TaxID=3364785 RepID=UPI0036E58A87